MEFIIISSPTIKASSPGIAKQLNSAPRITPIDGPLNAIITDSTLFASSGLQSLHGQYISWDGHGVVGTTAFSSGAELPLSVEQANNYLNTCLGSSGNTDMRGVFVYATFDKRTSEFNVALDPLSQYPLFLFTSGDTLITSNNVYLIEAVASYMGHSLTRSPEAGAFEAAFGVGAGQKTGFKQISLLPHGHMIAGNSTKWQIKKAQMPDYKKGYDYQQLLRLSVERLKNYMKALQQSSGNSRLLFDLTGGQDSRICFAAALAAGLPDIAIFSAGDDIDPDKRIAYQIAQKFGAKVGNYPENHDSQTISAKQRSQTAVFRQQGHSNLYHYQLGNVRLEGVCRVRGSAGELTRCFKDNPSKYSLFWEAPWKHIKQLLRSDTAYKAVLQIYWATFGSSNNKMASRWAYKYCNIPQSYQRLFHKQFIRSATHQLQADIAKAAETAQTMGTDIYLKDRAKRHFGYMSRGLNMTCGAFDPLYDPVILAAADALPETERANARLSFDLIEALGGKELLEIPFFKESITASQLKYLSERLSVPIEKLSIQPPALANVPRTNIKRANEQKISPANAPAPKDLCDHGIYLWNIRTYFIDLIQTLPTSHKCWNIFNRQNLLKAVAPNGYFFRNHVTATRGLRIFHTILWVAGEEHHSPIISRI